MKYKGVDIDWIAEKVLYYLRESDAVEETASISSSVASEDGISDNQVRDRLRRLRTVGLVNCDPETKKNIHDKNTYTLNSDELKSYLDKKDGGLSRLEVSSEDTAQLQSQLEEERTERRRLESEVRELKSQLELLQNHFNSRGHERIGNIEERVDYLMEHAEVEKRRWDALERLLDDHHVDFGEYFL